MLNLNNNRITDVYKVIDCLVQFRSLKSLYINLVSEDEVDYVLKKLKNLSYLNGLGVDREELTNAGGGGTS